MPNQTADLCLVEAAYTTACRPMGQMVPPSKKRQKTKLTPKKQENTLAFMFESSFIYKPTAFAINGGLRQENYTDCWQNISPMFNAAGTSK